MKINKDKFPQDILLNKILQEISDEVIPQDNELEEKNKRIQHSKRAAKKRMLNIMIFLLIIVGLLIIFYIPEVQPKVKKNPTHPKTFTQTIKKSDIKYKPEKSVKDTDMVMVSKKEKKKPSVPQIKTITQKPQLSEREIAKKKLLEQMK